jgi:hypothetical protein
MLSLSPHLTSLRAPSISREGAAFSTHATKSEPKSASDIASLDHAGHMGKYMKVLIAIALIIGGICLMVCAVLALVRELVRGPYSLSPDGDDGWEN